MLGTFGELTDRGFHVRPHYVFCSGNAYSTPHWGNGNVYHEDADGNPYYDFTVVDQTSERDRRRGPPRPRRAGVARPGPVTNEAELFTVPASPTV